MCGIAAILLNPQNRDDVLLNEIGMIFTQNLIFNEERGNAATGISITDDEGHISIYKAALPASKFVRTPRYAQMLSKIGSKTTLLLGHTRLPTKGDPSINDNNHPVRVGTVVGVHNGHVNNDDELFLNHSYPRTAEVDSEIIFRLIESIDPATMNDLYLCNIRPLIRRIKGQFTFMASDGRKPGQVLVLKHNNPLCIHFHHAWNALIFSSRYVFLRKAFGISLVAEALEQDQLLLYDAYKISDMGILPKEKLPLAP